MEKESIDYLYMLKAGHTGHLAGNPAHANIHNEFNRALRIFDVTAEKFTPVNIIAESHNK
ncbi:hypothetical protein ACNCLA_23900 (plasmid) [Escherichia coli]|nr:hypothetical protein [Salmonella enterica]MCV1955299.1 hypothetical protein [Escherichia coli]